MKKLFLLAFAIFAAFVFTACSDPESEPDPGPVTPEIQDEVISFEASESLVCVDGSPVALGTISVVSGKNSVSHDNVYWAKDYTVVNDLRKKKMLYFTGPFFSTGNGKVWFTSFYSDFFSSSGQFDTWGGFVLSSNVNKTVSSTQAGQDNQFEAYADGGAGGSKVFAVCYDAKFAQMDKTVPLIDFRDGAREPLTICLANSAWTYNYFKGNAADSYVVKITGKLAGAETGVVECPLISGAVKIDDWKAFDLSSLGEIDQLVFNVVCSESYAPAYFCVDNIVLKDNK